LHEIGVEVTEQIDIIPQKVQVLSHQRVKYGCRSCESKVVIADMPAQPIPKSMASASTLAHVAVAKYADHLPLYRQESMWSRLGIDLDRGTLAQWMVRVGKLVQPIINLMIEDIKDDGVVSIDETTVQVLREKDKKATSPGYMWVMTRAGPGPSITVFEYDKSRSGRVAERLLDDFKGTIVTDGFDGYKRLAFTGITRAACWAHVRRKFFEAAEIEGKNTDDKRPYCIFHSIIIDRHPSITKEDLKRIPLIPQISDGAACWGIRRPVWQRVI
jgi:transposase